MIPFAMEKSMLIIYKTALHRLLCLQKTRISECVWCNCTKVWKTTWETIIRVMKNSQKSKFTQFLAVMPEVFSFGMRVLRKLMKALFLYRRTPSCIITIDPFHCSQCFQSSIKKPSMTHYVITIKIGLLYAYQLGFQYIYMTLICRIGRLINWNMGRKEFAFKNLLILWITIFYLKSYIFMVSVVVVVTLFPAENNQQHTWIKTHL